MKNERNDKNMNTKYSKINSYLLPNLVINHNKTTGRINKYGYLRLAYIKKYKKGFYQTLLIKNKLNKHLFSVSNECEIRLKILMDNYIKNDERLSEKNKNINQIEGVKLINNYKNCAEEIIKNEIIYQ